MWSFFSKLSENESNFISDENPLPVATQLSKTAFGELLVGQLFPQFQMSFEYTVGNTDLNTNTVVDGGTVTQANAMALVGTSTTTASTARLQSKQHARYKSGLGGVIRMTAKFTAPVADTVQLVGLADETGSSAAFKNGYMIGYIGTVFGLHRFQNDVLTTVAIADWDDPLDGSGPSNMTLDQTKLGIFYIAFEYLGGGGFSVWTESDTEAETFIAHTEPYSNLNTTPSVHNPNFFFTAFTDNAGTTSDMVVSCGSYGYFVQGLTSFIELHQPHNTSSKREKTSVTTEVAIFTIRNKATYQSKTNFIDIVLESVTASIEAAAANNLGEVRLIRNTTLGGTPSYADINTANSVVEIDTAGTTVTGGKDLFTALLAGKNDRLTPTNFTDFKFILNPGETITVAGSSANAATIDSAALWKELF